MKTNTCQEEETARNSRIAVTFTSPGTAREEETSSLIFARVRVAIAHRLGGCASAARAKRRPKQKQNCECRKPYSPMQLSFLEKEGRSFLGEAVPKGFYTVEHFFSSGNELVFV